MIIARVSLIPEFISLFFLLSIWAIISYALYAVYSAIRTLLSEARSEDRTSGQKTEANDPRETQRRQEQEYQREQERVRREAEDRRAKEGQKQREEQRQRAEDEEAGRRASSRRSTAIKNKAYYGRILGLHGRVTWSDIRARYLELVRQYHPDRVDHLGPEFKALAEKKVKEINEAYEYFKRLYG